MDMSRGSKTSEAEIVAQCVEAAEHAAREQFARDGSKDCGSCGGMILAYRGRTRFALAILAAGQGYESDGKVWVNKIIPEDVHTQHAEVEIKAMQAFRDKAREHGFSPAKEWTYID